MASFYDDMAAIASELLTEFDQGGLSLDVYTKGQGDAWKPGSESYNSTPFNGVAKAVSVEHQKDSMIEAGDYAVTMPGNLNPTLDDRVTIDGRQHSIIKVTPIPAAGQRVSWLVFVRS